MGARFLLTLLGAAGESIDYQKMLFVSSRTTVNHSPRHVVVSSFSKKMVCNDAAVFTPNTMAITNDGDIASYILYFTMNDGHYPSRPVYQYGKYLISKNNTFVLTFTSLNAVDYSTLGSSVSLSCKIDEGVKVFLAQQNALMKTNHD
jgi:hypothetical protein